MAGRDHDTAFCNPSLDPLLVDAIGDRQCPEGPPSGVRIEACVDAVQESTIGVRVLPGPRVEGSRRLTSPKVLFEEGCARGSSYQKFEIQPVLQIQILCTMALRRR